MGKEMHVYTLFFFMIMCELSSRVHCIGSTLKV